MFRPIALYIGLRYNRARRRNAFISFISLTSMLGIALGVAVLITVLSVMNGFDQKIRERVFGMANHMTVTEIGGMRHWSQLAEIIKKDYPEVISALPFVAGQGMLTHNGQVQASFITGIDPAREGEISILPTKMINGNLTDLNKKRFGIVIGEQLAQSLDLMVGDKVVVVTPEWSVNIAGVMPTFKRFTVVGVFQVGNGFGFDSSFAFINIKDAKALYHLSDRVTGLRLKIKDLYKAPWLTQVMGQKLARNYLVNNWTQRFGNLFEAISMEKTMMFLILLLIIAVAAFNLVSTLVMVVTDKQSDIAILRTLGATPAMIMKTFMVQGSVIGVIGTLLGLIGGVLLANNVTAIFNATESFFHVKLLSSNVYYVNYLPSQLQWSDVWQICLASLVMTVIATLYPAWRAAKVKPAEALRYE